MFSQFRIGVVIPALNEEASIAKVITDLHQLEYQHIAIIDDIVVCDNGSTDNTSIVAKSAGARVVEEQQKGYGYACQRAIDNLKECDVIIFVDADYSDHAPDIITLLKEIEDSADLVIGSRETGKVEPGALYSHQRFGNWLLTRVINFLWKKSITDLGPLRAIRKKSFDLLQLQDKTYGWNIEMQIKAFQKKLDCREIPVTYKKRIGQSKISGNAIASAKACIKMIMTILTLWIEEKRCKHSGEITER